MGNTMKVEYKVAVIDNPVGSEQLNREFGEEGWMLQTILYWDGVLYHYFIRVKG